MCDECSRFSVFYVIYYFSLHCNFPGRLISIRRGRLDDMSWMGWAGYKMGWMNGAGKSNAN
jgi:hypothetical protein